MKNFLESFRRTKNILDKVKKQRLKKVEEQGEL